MGGRVSHGIVRYGSSAPLRSRLNPVQLVEVLQLDRLVQVIDVTSDYWFPNDFCT